MIKKKLLKMLLSADGKYIKGQVLCGNLKVSRQAVWKAINSLKKDGYTIETSRKEGYRLLSFSDKPSKAGIESLLEKKYIDYDVICFESIDSTNMYAMRYAGKDLNSDIHGKVIISDEQTSGMGRRGRDFISEKATGIYMSIILKPDISPKSISSITLVVAIAVCEVLKKLIHETGVYHEVGIKWPNDVLIDRKKVCGILTQTSSIENYISYVVCGLGINVNNTIFPDSIKEDAVSLFQVTDKKYNRQLIISDILNAFASLYEKYIRGEGLCLLKEEYNAMLLDVGEEICIYNGMVEDSSIEDRRYGILKGIDETGELLVDVGGVIQKVYSGEVSIRRLK